MAMVAGQRRKRYKQREIEEVPLATHHYLHCNTFYTTSTLPFDTTPSKHPHQPIDTPTPYPTLPYPTRPLYTLTSFLTTRIICHVLLIDQRRRLEKQEQQAFMDGLRQASVATTAGTSICSNNTPYCRALSTSFPIHPVVFQHANNYYQYSLSHPSLVVNCRHQKRRQASGTRASSRCRTGARASQRFIIRRFVRE